MKSIELGNTYRDRISGFEGIAVGHVVYLTGCNQTLLQPRGETAHTKPQSQWFDDQRIEDTGAETLVLDNGATPGCDRPAPRI